MSEKLACPHGFASRGSCVECMEDGPVVEPTKWLGVGLPFVAKYDADCADTYCSRPVVSGRHQVQRWDFGDERTVYTHRDCRPQ